MIEINLLPEVLKAKAKKDDSSQKFLLLLIPPCLILILLSVHLILGIQGMMISSKFSALNKKWRQLQPQVKQLDTYRSEHEPLAADSQFIQQFTNDRVVWSEKLNKLSLLLPDGIWFTDFSFTGKEFTLNGSAVSLQKEEMALVNTFISNLKKDALFYKDFETLQLSGAQSRQVSSYEVLNFTLKGALKGSDEKEAKKKTGKK